MEYRSLKAAIRLHHEYVFLRLYATNQLLDKESVKCMEKAGPFKIKQKQTIPYKAHLESLIYKWDIFCFIF